MAQLWVLTGDYDAPGWQVLRTDYEAETIEIIHLDAHVWAVIEADEAPTAYEGLSASAPSDGVYVDPNGSPLYLAGGAVVAGPGPVLEALGPKAMELADELGDPNRALEQLGRAF